MEPVNNPTEEDLEMLEQVAQEESVRGLTYDYNVAPDQTVYEPNPKVHKLCFHSY